MSGIEPGSADLDGILQRDILPTVFPATAPDTAPTLVIAIGQPGAGRSRLTGAVLADHPDIAVLNAQDLAAFHPRYVELTRDRAPDAAQVLARATADWIRGSIRFARENHRSLLLDGGFDDPAIVAATADLFAGAGYRTHVVVAASRRAESLLSVLSHDLRSIHAGQPVRVTARSVHDRAWDATPRVVEAVADAASIHRLTIRARDGRVIFDEHRTDAADPFAGARAALSSELTARMGRWDATQWLSELHHVTDYATSRRNLPREVTEILVDLHEMSLREVIPQLHVPADGKFATAMEQKTVARLVALRRALPTERAVDAAVPTIAAGGPEPGGISR